MLWRTTALLVSSLALVFACKNASTPPAAEVEQEAVRITKWTERSELFVEFPPLMTGKETAFAAHLTDLKTFKAVDAGVLKVTLTGQGREVAAVAEAPTVPGIYRPVLKVDQPGNYRLAFQRYRPGSKEVYDTIDAGEVKVVEKPAAEQPAQEAAQAKSITFLKEQQWRMDFATEPVREQELAALLKMSAEVKPAAAGQAQIAVPFAGRILIAGSGAPTLGRRVKQGEELAVILPLPNKSRAELDGEHRTAKSELEAAEKELERVEELHKDKIVPRRRLEQSQRDVAVQKARLDAARAQLGTLDPAATGKTAGERFSLRSPIAGTIVAANITPGALVDAGQNLFTIIDLDRLWIEGRLFEVDIPKLRKFERAFFSSPALTEPLVLTQPKVRLVHIGSVIDAATRSVPVILEARNDGGHLKIGLFGDLTVPTGERVRGLAVPLGAIVDDKGVAVSFVQVEGESFERRELELGIKSGGYAEVKSGLKSGERVVSRGAYRVHLGSVSSQLPAHGHAH